MKPWISHTIARLFVAVAVAGTAIAGGPGDGAGDAAAVDDAINHFTAADAAALIDAGWAVLVDVRGPDERSMGRAAGDIHLPPGEVVDRVHDLPADRIVICYCDCAGEETSLSVAEALLDIGFDRVGVLVGGYDAWVDLGRETVVERTEAEVLRLDEPPIGWIKARAPEGYRTEHREGALVIEGEGGDLDGERAAVMQELDAEPLRGRSVTFEIDLQLTDVGGVSTWIRAVGEGGRVVEYAGLDPGPVTGTVDRERYRVSMRVPEEALTIDFGVVLGGPGEVMADDASLTFTDDGTPVPGPVNLDFAR